MARKTYVFDPEKGCMVEKRFEAPSRVFHVLPDIEPYQAVGPEFGKVISSRSKHRAYLKQHGLVEVGDQKPKWMRNER